jgi:hypothetical protein
LADFTGATISLGIEAFTPTQLVLTGGDASVGCAGCVYGTLGVSPCQVQATINLPGTYNFNWSDVTADEAGSARDIFGVMAGGVRVALSGPGGAVSQSGIRSFVVTSSFALMLNCTDCTGGVATATISNFNFPPVPELSQALLLCAGGPLLGAAGLTRRSASR